MTVNAATVPVGGASWRASCPRCGTPLTLAAALATLEETGGKPEALSADPSTPLAVEFMPHVPWACSRCGEDSELLDFRSEAPLDDPAPRSIARSLEERRWRTWAVTLCGDTPAARAASDSDLAHMLERRIAAGDQGEQLRHHLTTLGRMIEDGESGWDRYIADALEEVAHG